VSRSEFYHVGIVVEEIESASRRLSALLGVEWGPIVEADTAVRTADGDDDVISLRLRYSTNAPRLELVEERAGTPWICNAFSNLHHIGYFSDTLANDGRRLSEQACPLEICGREGELAPHAFSYHRDPLGVRIEYVDAAGRPLLEEYLFKKAPS